MKVRKKRNYSRSTKHSAKPVPAPGTKTGGLSPIPKDKSKMDAQLAVNADAIVLEVRDKLKSVQSDLLLQIEKLTIASTFLKTPEQEISPHEEPRYIG